MRPDLRERRERTWQLLVVQGLDYTDVCEQLADEYDVKPNTIEKDISRMDNWLPKLEELSDTSAYSRLKELRMNRQRLHQMAEAAQDANDLSEERRIREIINHAIENDISVAQSVGLLEKEPDKVEVDGTTTHEHTHQLPPETEQLLGDLTGSDRPDADQSDDTH